MSETDLTHQISSFRRKFKTYSDTLNRKNKAEVDCVGTFPKKGYDAALDAICWPAKPRRRTR